VETLPFFICAGILSQPPSAGIYYQKYQYQEFPNLSIKPTFHRDFPEPYIENIYRS
jgi:hypothetical protein